MSAQSNAVPDSQAESRAFDFDSTFEVHYPRLARVIARLTGDPARSEELAVEALWKLWNAPEAHNESAGGWLYRTAVRLGLNELRATGRRARHESLAAHTVTFPDPEQARAAEEERRQVRDVLAALDSRQAGLLVLRASGLSYAELAAALEINPASVGTLLSRAQEAFRKEYVKRHGTR